MTQWILSMFVQRPHRSKFLPEENLTCKLLTEWGLLCKPGLLCIPLHYWILWSVRWIKALETAEGRNMSCYWAGAGSPLAQLGGLGVNSRSIHASCATCCTHKKKYLSFSPVRCVWLVFLSYNINATTAGGGDPNTWYVAANILKHLPQWQWQEQQFVLALYFPLPVRHVEQNPRVPCASVFCCRLRSLPNKHVIKLFSLLLHASHVETCQNT